MVKLTVFLRYSDILNFNNLNPNGKADDTPSHSLPRIRGRRLQLHPGSLWILGHPRLSLS